MTRKQAARMLRVSLRTIHNYVKKYLDQGSEGLLDHRRGHFRKIGTDLERRIVALRLDRPAYSARWLRDRMKLNVSVETVRQVLLKYGLNRGNLGPRSNLSGKLQMGPILVSSKNSVLHVANRRVVKRTEN